MLVLYLTVVVFMIRRKAYTFDYNSLKGVYYVVLNRVPDIMKILRGAYITSDTLLSKPVGFQYPRTKYMIAPDFMKRLLVCISDPIGILLYIVNLKGNKLKYF